MNTAALDPEGTRPARIEEQIRALGQAPGRLTMASVVRAGEALGEALAGDRHLGREDRTVLGLTSVAILFAAAVAALVPTVVGWTVAVIAGWFGVTAGVRAYVQARRARIEERAAARRSQQEEEGS